jgi:hypothetical protein
LTVLCVPYIEWRTSARQRRSRTPRRSCTSRSSYTNRCQESMAYIRQSRLNAGLGFQCLTPCYCFLFARKRSTQQHVRLGRPAKPPPLASQGSLSLCKALALSLFLSRSLSLSQSINLSQGLQADLHIIVMGVWHRPIGACVLAALTRNPTPLRAEA